MSFYIAMLVIWSPEMINCTFTYIDILPRFVKNIVFQSSLLKFDSESLSRLDILFHNFVFFFVGRSVMNLLQIFWIHFVWLYVYWYIYLKKWAKFTAKSLYMYTGKLVHRDSLLSPRVIFLLTHSLQKRSVTGKVVTLVLSKYEYFFGG